MTAAVRKSYMDYTRSRFPENAYKVDDRFLNLYPR